MVSEQELDFESEYRENVLIDDIRRSCSDGIIIWVCGSGSSPDGGMASYNALLEKKGMYLSCSGDREGYTANQIMITGLQDAAGHIRVSSKVYVVCAAALGFAKAFRGKGCNGVLLQQFLQILSDKQCKLTEVVFCGGGSDIREYILVHGQGTEAQREWFAKKKEEKKEYVSAWKEKVYRECLTKVLAVLCEEGIEEPVLLKVRNIRPE